MATTLAGAVGPDWLTTWTITVILPIVVTFIGMVVNWIVHGAGPFKAKHAMIGSDLVIAFIAVTVVHAFQYSASTGLRKIDGFTAVGGMLGYVIVMAMTIVLILICAGMEQAANSGDSKAGRSHVIWNLGIGFVPLSIATLIFTS